MATLTTNISNVSLTVSGTTQQSATISWTCPSVPSGLTISSCTLTGTATASMSKGSATITVNGTSVSSGSNFTINLGTGNTTSSVAATAKGGNKNAAGTVTLSNLVYTVNYTEPLVTYTVTFVDWDGTVLKTQTVESGSSATAPSNPSREGYNFTGWDKDATNITSDIIVTAQYSAIMYIVTFVDWDGTVLKTEEVAYGSAAIAPAVNRYGYELTGWSVDFSNVTSNITTTAMYVTISVLMVKENGVWVNIPRIYKKISGSWVEQAVDNWGNLFDSNAVYAKRGLPVPSAILYSDGAFIFSNYNVIDTSHGDVIAVYTGWDTDSYSFNNIPWSDNLTKITNVYINNIKPNNTAYWFYNLSYLTNVAFNNFDTSNVTNMNGMFDGCSALTILDVSNFDTSKVTDMGLMFYDCSSLITLDVSNFDTSNVTNMNGMFSNCHELTTLDVGNFDTSKVTNTSFMFKGCSSLTSLDLSNFDTSNVTDMKYMFSGCSALISLDLSNFDTSNVTNVTYMFDGCSMLESVDLSNCNFNNVSEYSWSAMFNGCTNPNLTIYVKDEATKTKIESSDGFPSTATVIIGSPN